MERELRTLITELRELSAAAVLPKSLRRMTRQQKRNWRAELMAQTEIVRCAMVKFEVKVREERLHRRYPGPPAARFITPVKDLGDRLADRELEEKLFDARRARAAASIR